MSNKFHPYHLVDPRSYPYTAACGLFLSTLGTAIYCHYSVVLVVSLGFLVLSATFVWYHDVARESNVHVHHTEVVKKRFENRNASI